MINMHEQEQTYSANTINNANDSYQRVFHQMATTSTQGFPEGQHVNQPYRVGGYQFPVSTTVQSVGATPIAPHHMPLIVPQQQQGPWLQGTNSEMSQNSQHQFQRLKVEDALSYLDQVKLQFGGQPQVYNNFLDIMKEFKSQTIDTPGVISRVSHLFAGHPDLIVGFNTFLPPGYKIEVQPNETIRVYQPGQQVISLANLGSASSVSQHYLPKQEPLNVATVPPASQHLGQLASQVQAPPSGQPVEFNHAINYVNKIKIYYNGRPEIYKAFLDILHNYQKEQKNVKEQPSKPPSVKMPVTEAEVYSQVANLFKDNPELLSEFRQFLPDSNGSGGFMNGLGAAESAFGGIGLGLGQVGGGDHTAMNKNLSPMSQRTSVNSSSIPPSKRRKLSFSKETPLIDNKDENGSTDKEFFEQLKRIKGNDPQIQDLFRCVDKYKRNVISADDFTSMMKPVVEKFPELKQRLTRLTSCMPLDLKPGDHTGSVRHKEEQIWHIDYSTCKQLPGQLSYRILSKSWVSPTCSGRQSDNVDNNGQKMNYDEILNDKYRLYCGKFPALDDDLPALKRNLYEDHVFQIEDERYETDMVIEPHRFLARNLEEIAMTLQKMSAEDQLKFQIPDLGTTCQMSDALINKIFHRLYDDKWDTIVEGLKWVPSLALPLIIRRLREKEVEWMSSKKKFDRLWSEDDERYYHKSLDYQGPKFKQHDMKQIKIKALIKEIEDLASQRCENANNFDRSPHMTMTYEDKEIVLNAVNLINNIARRQSWVQNDDDLQIKWILKRFLLELFMIPVDQTEDNNTNEENSQEEKKESINGSHKRKQTTTTANKQEMPTIDSNYIKINIEQLDEKRMTFLCNDNWYLFLRLFVMLCNRLQHFSKHARHLAEEEEIFAALRPKYMVDAINARSSERIHPRQSYQHFLNSVQNLLQGTTDMQSFEDQTRELFGIHAYVAFTIDKVVQMIVRQIQHLITKSECAVMMDCYEKKQKQEKESLVEEDDYRKSVQRQLKNENCFRIQFIQKLNSRLMTIELLSNENEEMSNNDDSETKETPSSPNEEVDPHKKSDEDLNCNDGSKMEEDVGEDETMKNKSFADYSPTAAAADIPALIPTWTADSHHSGNLASRKAHFLSRNLPRQRREKMRKNRTGLKKAIAASLNLGSMDEDAGFSNWFSPSTEDSQSKIDKKKNKDFIFKRLTALSRSRELHKELSMRKFTKFRRWFEDWKTSNINGKSEEECCNWFCNGIPSIRSCQTTRNAINREDRPPYHNYTKYSVVYNDPLTDVPLSGKLATGSSD